MATRTIKASIRSGANSDLAPGSAATFTVTSDSGAISDGDISGGSLYLSSIRTYAATFYLAISFGGSTLANTSGHESESSTHSEDVSLSDLSDDLLTEEPSTITLTVKKISGSGNKINFREGCTITLTIDYKVQSTGGGSGESGDDDGGGETGGASIAAVDVKLSSNTSYGEDVTMSFTYPGSIYDLDMIVIHKYYSEDGVTWSNDYSYTPSVGVYSCYERGDNYAKYSVKVSPPEKVWTYYRFRIYTVGVGAEDYALTDWVVLQRVRPVLVEYTDSPIVPGETHIKAVHMLELQTNINRIREAEQLSNYAFSEIKAGYTGLAGWRAHIAELRAAIDEMGISHETWIAVAVNKPRADVIEQLRRVVAAL